MGFRTLLITYILGGLTFVPLLLLAILIPAWYLSPRVDKGASTKRAEAAKAKELADAVLQEKDGERSRGHSLTGETAASGTFAVLRQYDFQAAVSALNAKSAGTGNGMPGTDGSAVGDGGVNAGGLGGGSESVYQSMYRSVFDWSKNASSTASLLQRGENSSEPSDPNKPVRKRPVAANVLYILLRHGHLMIYDSPAQVEVKHVISLAHHTVSLQSGVGVEEEEDVRQIPEPDLFIKRTAIVLTPIDMPNGALQPSSNQPQPKPFYLFSATCIEKEDFYHALLATRAHPPIPRPLDTDALIKLQSALHSSSLTTETRALNALLGRVFLAIHRGDQLNKFIRGKIEKKLARIQKPSFIPVLNIQSIDLGDAAPFISHPRLRDLNINGDMTVAMDMRYTGGLSITLLAVAKLDLGARFKVRTVDLMLKTSIQRVAGTLLVRIKPPPSNRIWFTFETMPEMEVRVEPVVSERKITYGFILRAIEERIRTAVAEGLVKPNWDDLPMPQAETLGSHARGGLWSDEGEPDDPKLRSEKEEGKAKAERSSSVPTLLGDDESAASAVDFEKHKLRSSATMPIEESHIKRRPVGQTDTPRRRPIRSPSLTAPPSPAPIVAVDDQHVEPVRADDASIRSMPQSSRGLWRGRSLNSQAFQKDALEELREIRNQAESAMARPSSLRTGSSGEEDAKRQGSVESDLGPTDIESDRRSLQSSDYHGHRRLSSNASYTASTSATTPRGGNSLPSRAESIRSSIASSSSASSTKGYSGSNQAHQPGEPTSTKKSTILSATATAANAARTWGWNTLQKNKDAFQQAAAARAAARGSSGTPEGSPSMPYGRGQPLPPPGVPLPGPQKGLWAGLGGSMRRRPTGPGGSGAAPALPPRRPRTAEDTTVPADKTAKIAESELEIPEDEFGPWSENSGAGIDESNYGAEYGVEGDVFDDAGDDQGDISPGAGNAETTRLGHPPRQDAGEEPTNTKEKIISDKSSASNISINIEDVDEPPRTRHKSTKVPPPLPARRRARSPAEHEYPTPSATPKPADSSTASSSAENLSTAARVPLSASDDDSNALRISSSPAARAIASENSTPALAHGEGDDTSHTDPSKGDLISFDATTPDTTITHGVVDEPRLPPSPVPGPRAERAEEKFIRGEKVDEGDFDEKKIASNAGTKSAAAAAALLATGNLSSNRSVT